MEVTLGSKNPYRIFLTTKGNRKQFKPLSLFTQISEGFTIKAR